MIRRASFIILITVIVLITACGSQQPTAGSAASLVTGVVAAGPAGPGARPGASGTVAVRGIAVEALRANQVMAIAHTNGAGRYELRLQPGTYLIRAQSDKYLSREQSKMVSLSRGQHLTVNLVFDTGIS